jgi:hypothetical protein
MRITASAHHDRLALLTGDALRLYDLSTGDARETASTPLPDGDCLASCDALLAVVTGKVAPGGASIRAAKLARYTWALAPLGAPAIGEVARHHIALRTASARSPPTGARARWWCWRPRRAAGSVKMAWASPAARRSRRTARG